MSFDLMGGADGIQIYQSENGAVEVRLDDETVWLRQEQMALLFGRERSVVSKHLRNVFAEGELERHSVCANFAHTAAGVAIDHQAG